MKFTDLYPSTKRKVIALGLGALALAASAWLFSFKKTWQWYNQVGQNEMQIKQLADAPRQAAEYQAQLAQLDRRSWSKPYDREELFEAVNTFCREHRIQILRLHPEARQSEKDFELVTNQLDLQGDFTDLVRLAWFIEQEQQLGKLSSTTYRLLENKRTAEKSLVATFYLQHITQYDPKSPD